MEESLSVLMNAKECPEDERLVSLVKIHLVMDKVYHLQRDGDCHHPSTFYTKAFQSQLEAVKSSIPSHLQEDSMFVAILPHNVTTANSVNQRLSSFTLPTLNSQSTRSPSELHLPPTHRNYTD